MTDKLLLEPDQEMVVHVENVPQLIETVDEALAVATVDILDQVFAHTNKKRLLDTGQQDYHNFTNSR